ncbi:MAG: HAMP domain-containing histidine kinase, partial [Clostridia bacterium]|nr:HAMP domain-containing histidine kinase [Clostridia bacterium]
MRKGGNTKKGMRTGRSLNLILWFTFSIFALVSMSVYAVAQNALMNKKYRDQASEILTEAGERIEELFSASEEGDSLPLAQEVYSKANSYGLQLFLIYEDGRSVFPDYTEEDSYPERAEFLKKKLNGEEGRTFADKAEISYGKAITIDGEPCFLYLSTTSHWLDGGGHSLRYVSLLTGLVALVLAFIASGFVTLLITKPVSEVTERAKELARGNYNLDFKKDYFCAEITELSDALEYARGEISKADQMQKELIANVSHDFKTPLTMIKAYASMIREISGEDKEKRDAHAQVIIDESDRLATLVGDLLDLSKIRAGLASDERSVFNLSDEVYRVASRFDYLKETNGYVIETEIEDDIYTLAGRERIEQVLYNLIGNAV